MSKRSGGSSLGGIAGLILMVAFFLPWIRSCAGDFSGYDLARNTPGVIEDTWVYWLTLLAGLVCLGVYILLNTGNRGGRIAGALIRLIAALIALLPLIRVWLNIRQQGEGLVEILFGAYLVALGYLGVFASVVIDFMTGGHDEYGKPPDDFSAWS